MTYMQYRLNLTRINADYWERISDLDPSDANYKELKRDALALKREQAIALLTEYNSTDHVASAEDRKALAKAEREARKLLGGW